MKTEFMDEFDFQKWIVRWGWFIVITLTGASFAGIAALLRDGKKVSLYLILRAAFVALIVGVIFLSALWDSLAVSRPGWLIAVVVCAGAGGGNMLDALVRFLRKRLDSKIDNDYE